MSDVTRILTAIEDGDQRAAEKLLPVVYDELRRLADQKLWGESPGQTLQATALVHDAYIRAMGEGLHPWDSRVHYVAAASEGNTPRRAAAKGVLACLAERGNDR